ncbi:CHASE2 domain-containing protein [Caulobacter sp. NIBR1757]|uniref:CHASE2 domain-containing protein n=1 Tax=Caulobacter sp. NIBR1757 TaxID=3016000 RepID=UPI0022EFFFFF|nr:CHASE2 domain-containing protein [Caulobacter sp. NIBR1757]WGM37772.1 hypothetical protein AMEJIAPC_00672 [Caulobacter sp. NIBR1757]
MKPIDWRDVVIRTLLGTALLFVIMLTDPMGLDEATDRHSADVVSRMTAPFYGGPTHDGRRRIAVVQISDQTISDPEVGWPPPRMFYARLLKRIAGGTSKPAVVFFDYAFISETDWEDRQALLDAVRAVTSYDDWSEDETCQASALAKIRCIAAAGGVPVIIGKVYPPNACIGRYERLERDGGDDVRLFHTAVVAPLGWPDLPTTSHLILTRHDYAKTLTEAFDGSDIADAERPGQIAPGLIRECQDLNPDGRLVPLLSVDPEAVPVAAKDPLPPRMITWSPLGHPGKQARVAPDPYDPGEPVFGFDVTPAAAMALALCLHDKTWTGPKAALCSVLRRSAETGAMPALQDVEYSGPEWGSISDPQTRDNRKLFNGDGTPFPEEPITEAECRREHPTISRAVEVGWAQLRSGLGKGAAAVAVPCPYHLTFDANDVLISEPELLDAVRSQLADRAVAIGAAQALSNDWIATTLNARQAGVHYHAMMLDNLLEKGLDLRRKPPEIFAKDGPRGAWGLDWLKLDGGEVLEILCGAFILFLIERTRADFERRPTEETSLPKPFEGWRRERDLAHPLRWLARVRLNYREYWEASSEDRYRIGQVILTLTLAMIALVLLVALTISNHWEPLNVVGLFTVSVLFVAAELWTHKGWAAVFGQLTAVLLFAPGSRRRKFREWFGRPAQPPGPTPEPPALDPATRSARPRKPRAAAKPRTRRKDSP